MGHSFFDCTPSVRQILWAHLLLFEFSSAHRYSLGTLRRNAQRVLRLRRRASRMKMQSLAPTIQKSLKSFSRDQLPSGPMNMVRQTYNAPISDLSPATFTCDDEAFFAHRIRYRFQAVALNEATLPSVCSAHAILCGTTKNPLSSPASLDGIRLTKPLFPSTSSSSMPFLTAFFLLWPRRANSWAASILCCSSSSRSPSSDKSTGWECFQSW